MQNAALLALMYLEGALAPDCPLVTFAAAGEMAQVGLGCCGRGCRDLVALAFNPMV